ncbi:MAG: substrate-binding domain-containing protein [Clostridia bacterium]|nr:substrate-binding domain-containing protein [Clostridia bacterium]
MNKKEEIKKLLLNFGAVSLFLISIPLSFYGLVFWSLGVSEYNISPIISLTGVFLIPSFTITVLLVNKKYKKTVLLIWLAICLATCGITAAKIGIIEYEKSLIIDTAPNIDTGEYLPFDENSKIATLDNEASLKFEVTDKLPIIDGAAAVFTVYSAFVNAVYPDTVELGDTVFKYNNTVTGYKFLAEKKTDIFFGAYPSKKQLTYADENNTEFTYTPIGSDAFIFFVHKNNPIDNLTSEQIKKIYSGEITNWTQLGGKNEPIAAFQRNEGSGSQSMLIRFMNGTPIMEPPTEMRSDYMFSIVEDVARYKSKSGSIGFSFRYYIEGIIQNPDIKLLSIDGVSPSVENIKSKAYPLTTPLYAVSYKDNKNENVSKLIDWVLSNEGQELIQKTGYVGVK